MLLDFAVEGYIGQATKHAEAELARLEATIAIDRWQASSLGFRESAVVQANEPDRGAARRDRGSAARRDRRSTRIRFTAS